MYGDIELIYTAGPDDGDSVKLAAYAPLFGNLTATHWAPDLIWFNNSTVTCSVNYYIQQIFSCNAGSALLESETEGAKITVSDTFAGKVGVGTWNTAAYKCTASSDTFYDVVSFKLHQRLSYCLSAHIMHCTQFVFGKKFVIGLKMIVFYVIHSPINDRRIFVIFHTCSPFGSTRGSIIRSVTTGRDAVLRSKENNGPGQSFRTAFICILLP